MTDFKQEIPGSLTKLVAHVCGLVFALLIFLSVFAIYILLSTFTLGALILLLISVALTYFFGRTAFRLRSNKGKNIIPKVAMLGAAASLCALSVLAIALTEIAFMNDEIDTLQMLSMNLLSTASVLYSFRFFRYVKKNF